MVKRIKKVANRAEKQAENEDNITDLWEGIGFHKAIAGYWYRFGLIIIAMIFGGFYIFYFYGYLFPFPITNGYKAAATGIFILFFRIFDLGTHMTMDRFIAEAKIKNPAKMMHYIQYFIWYQMITGLLQTTGIAFYALYFVPRTDLSYTVWFMLINSLTQYPGFLGAFSGILNSLQYFDKAQKVSFISTDIIQRLTEVGFVILGKLWGEANPEIGAIMGITMGSIIGRYVDDFLAMGLSAYYFQKVMANQGVHFKDCFRMDFDFALVKETFWFGVRTGAPGLLSATTGTVILGLYLVYLPQYTTYVALLTYAAEMANMINLYNSFVPIQPLITEAYMNGKKKLTQYYIGQTIKITAHTQGFMVAIVLFFMSGLERVYPMMNMDAYLLSIPFIVPAIIPAILAPYVRLADRIVYGTDHATFIMIVRLLEEGLKVVFIWLFLVVLALPEKYGFPAIVWILTCGGLPATIIKTGASYFYTYKRIVPIKVPWWQAFGTSGISGLIIFSLSIGAKMLFWNPLMGTKLEILGIALSMIVALGGMIFLYFPLTTLLGGWDSDSMAQFGQGARMSGVAKILVMPMYKGVKRTSQKAKLHNRFHLPYEEAHREAKELLELKNANRQVWK